MPRHGTVAVSLAVLLVATHALGAQPPLARTGTLHGTVYDSLARAPLAGATVQLVHADELGAGHAVTTDTAGAFRIDSLAPGRWLVRFAHPLLDRLGVDVAPRVVALHADSAESHVALAVPSLEQVRRVVCGRTVLGDSTGLLVGRVRDVGDGAPIANATVLLSWRETTLGARGVRSDQRRVRATTGASGGFVVCGVPVGEEIVASANRARRESGEIVLEMPGHGFLMRDFALGGPRVADARLAGTVRDSSGRPLRGARVLVRDASTTVSADDAGRFAIGGLPTGTRMLEVRAIGFTPRRMSVDLTPGRTQTVDVTMSHVALLDPVTVFGAPGRRSQALQEFFERKQRDLFGRFLTAVDMQHRTAVTDALRTVPGIQIVADAQNGQQIFGRPKGMGPCRALVILDGLPLEGYESIDQLVSPHAVAGIEVYAEGAFAPPQYGATRLNNCSVVLVWTKARPGDV